MTTTACKTALMPSPEAPPTATTAKAVRLRDLAGQCAGYASVESRHRPTILDQPVWVEVFRLHVSGKN